MLSPLFLWTGCFKTPRWMLCKWWLRAGGGTLHSVKQGGCKGEGGAHEGRTDSWVSDVVYLQLEEDAQQDLLIQ